MKFKKLTFAPVPALAGVFIAALVAWGLAHWTGLGFWASFAIVVVSMLVNGFIAEVEDNEPGGFNNPLSDGTKESASKRDKSEGGT